MGNMTYTIIIEDTVYKVTKTEYTLLDNYQERIRRADYPKNVQLEEELSCYLDENKRNYKKIGVVMFDHRR